MLSLVDQLAGEACLAPTPSVSYRGPHMQQGPRGGHGRLWWENRAQSVRGQAGQEGRAPGALEPQAGPGVRGEGSLALR